MDSFREQIAGLLSAELKMPKEQVYSLIETPPEGMGDYAFPCFGLAKELHKAPNQIAIELAARIKHSALISRIEPKGAYINFFINPQIAGHA